MQFIRFVRKRDEKEILISVASIWKVEVQYVTLGQNRTYFTMPVAEGAKSPGAVRKYKVFAGSEVVTIIANPDDPVSQVLEGIYQGAVKNIPDPPPIDSEE